MLKATQVAGSRDVPLTQCFLSSAARGVQDPEANSTQTQAAVHSKPPTPRARSLSTGPA